jgi:actin-related protein
MSPDVILDLGCYQTVTSLPGSDAIPLIEPTIIADSTEPLILKPFGSSFSKLNSERYYGTNALKYKNVLKLTHFLRKHDYYTLAFFLQHLFENIGKEVEPRNCGVVLITPANLTQARKQELKNILFTTLNLPKIAFLPPAACVLTALGLDTGVIIDIGHYSTRIESIYKGFPRIESQFTYSMGGSHITAQLLKQMIPYKKFQAKSPLFEIAEQVKRDAVQVSENILFTLQEIERGTKKYDYAFDLPDGTHILLNKERFLSSELFFQPELARLHSENLIVYIEQSIRAWDRSAVRELCRNIIICGGGSQIPGLAKRIQILLEARFPASIKIEIKETGTESKTIFWKGANIIYQLRQGELGEWELNPFREEL